MINKVNENISIRGKKKKKKNMISQSHSAVTFQFVEEVDDKKIQKKEKVIWLFTALHTRIK